MHKYMCIYIYIANSVHYVYAHMPFGHIDSVKRVLGRRDTHTKEEKDVILLSSKPVMATASS